MSDFAAACSSLDNAKATNLTKIEFYFTAPELSNT